MDLSGGLLIQKNCQEEAKVDNQKVGGITSLALTPQPHPVFKSSKGGKCPPLPSSPPPPMKPWAYFSFSLESTPSYVSMQ